MGHAHHFLSRLDRVSTAQTELALSLYRDPELLCEIMKHARVPATEERVAISLGHPERGPFIIVTRGGNFVTCLAEGMHLGNRFVVTRDKLGEVAAWVSELRRRIEAATSINEAGKFVGIANRLYGGDALSREDMDTLLSLKPVFAAEAFRMASEDATKSTRTLLSMVKLGRPRGRDKERLRATWQRAWSFAHNLVFCGGESLVTADPLASSESHDRRFAMVNASVNMAVTFVALRGIWCAASVGKPLVEPCFERYVNTKCLNEHACGLLGLVAIACRHPELRDSIRRSLSKPFNRAQEPHWKGWHDAQQRQLAVVFDPQKGPAEAARLVRKAAYTTALQRLPAQSRYHYAQAEDVPLDLAIPLVMRVYQCAYLQEYIRWATAVLPVIANARAEELYPPRALLAEVRHGWSEEAGMVMVNAFRQKLAPLSPVRVERGPGPNERCRCGSGKKHKHCCGRVGVRKEA